MLIAVLLQSQKLYTFFIRLTIIFKRVMEKLFVSGYIKSIVLK